MSANFSPANSAGKSVISPDLLRRYDVAGPRYTSYPTADRFVEAFGEADYVQALVQRKEGLGVKVKPLSLYVHIPFCESLCYYCACNKIITKHHERGEEYLRYLEREVALTVAHLGLGPSGVAIALGRWQSHIFERCRATGPDGHAAPPFQFCAWGRVFG